MLSVRQGLSHGALNIALPPTAYAALTLNLGQSLAESHVGGGNMTTAQEGNSLAFGGLGSTTLYPLVSTNAALSPATPSNDGETPMHGVCGYLFELLQKENGILPTDVTFTPVTANNAAGSTSIFSNNKGTTRYGYGITQAAALRSAYGGLARALASGWYQGEADYSGTFASYYAALTTLAKDYSADLRAALPEQTFDHHLVTFGMCSRPDGGLRFTVPRAQLQAAVDYINGVIPSGLSAPSPVGFSTPNHHMDRLYDPTGVHVPARDAKWMGGYVALYIKRVFFDKVGWPPMYPLRVVSISGNDLYVQFQMRSPGASFVLANGNTNSNDGRFLPPQTNGGWSAYNTNTSSVITLSGTPTISASDTLKFTAAGGWSSGFRLDYAQGAPSNMAPFIGGAGNFRDNYGDSVFYNAVNRPMHNWLPILSFQLDGSAAGLTMPRV